MTFEMFELTQPEILDHMPSVEEYELLKENYVAIMELANEGRPHLESMKQRLRSRNPTGLSCGADQRLTIDCAGNIYHCRVTAERNDARRVQASVPLMCADCRYVSDCRGICPVMPDSLRKNYAYAITFITTLSEQQRRRKMLKIEGQKISISQGDTVNPLPA